ncbi:MAG TPA: ROK family protein [Steroidobacteraceae bacterium]|nr:ROK family protein [Steroidobacteraceae bacterium]
MIARARIIGAVDIGGTKIAVGAIDHAGRVLAREESPTAARDGFGAAMVRIDGMLRRVRERAGGEFSGIGIGCTGPVEPVSGDIGDVDFLPGWQGRNPVEELAGRFNLSVAMENDADAAALAEFVCGAGRGKRHLICVTVGTGIGGGIVLNGQLYRGVGGVHPEIGHHVIDAAGPECFCGAHGCWEVLARGPAMPERLLRTVPEDYAHRANLTAERICELARRGDPAARREVAREAEYLGIGVANLITLYAPEVVVLAGSVMQSADLLLPPIRDTVARQCRLVPANTVEIAASALKNDAALIGAAMVWLRRHRRNAAA